jgi:hypothetical protein
MILNAIFVLLAEDGIQFEKVADFLDSVKGLYAYTVIESDGISF